MVAGAGSTGGFLAVCIRRLKNLFTSNRIGLFEQTQEK
jgi:hypothetical protein